MPPKVSRVRVDRSGKTVKVIRTPRSPASGLNKTEKKQTKKIVAAAIKKEHALKYFNSDGTTEARAPTVSAVGNTKEVSVIGFSSTTEFDNTGTAVKFGSQDLHPLHLSRPFKENAPEEALAEQALDGQYCLPKIARTSFSIERVAYRVGISGSAVDVNMARSLPISYRILKVGYKAQIGTETTVNPNVDLFIDRFGQPTSIDKDGFHRLDCRNLNVNTKKYVKLMDMRGTIQQNNIITANEIDGGTNHSDIVTQKSGKSMVHMTIPFQLSARKNGKLFYATPQQAGAGPNTFTSGGKRELILMFFYYDNGHTLVGGEGRPQAPDLNDIQIKTLSTSAFVDAN